MVSAAFLPTARTTLAAINLVMSFSSLVLAAIDIHKIIEAYGGYNRIDPAFLVVAVFALFWFLSIIAMARKSFFLHKAKNVIIISLLHSLYYFGTAIAYVTTRYKASYNCPTGPLRQVSGCKGILQGLMALDWIDFVLTLLYALTVYLLAKKHSSLPWTNRENGMNVGVSQLCPSDDRKNDLEKGIGKKDTL